MWRGWLLLGDGSPGMYWPGNVVEIIFFKKFKIFLFKLIFIYIFNFFME
jgi:hypothetical protein